MVGQVITKVVARAQMRRPFEFHVVAVDRFRGRKISI